MELKNCPFCGAKVKITTQADWFFEFIEESGHAAVSIECTNHDCGCQYWCHSHVHNSTDYETALNVAIERWNHRAEDQKSESL